MTTGYSEAGYTVSGVDARLSVHDDELTPLTASFRGVPGNQWSEGVEFTFEPVLSDLPAPLSSVTLGWGASRATNGSVTRARP